MPDDDDDIDALGKGTPPVVLAVLYSVKDDDRSTGILLDDSFALNNGSLPTAGDGVDVTESTSSPKRRPANDQQKRKSNAFLGIGDVDTGKNVCYWEIIK